MTKPKLSVETGQVQLHNQKMNDWLAFYNTERAHTGRYPQGRTPWETLIGARKMRPR